MPVTVEVTCTGKGSHRRLPMGVYQKTSGGWHKRQLLERWDGGGYELAPLAGRDGLCRFECRRCGRKPQVTAATLTKFFEGLAANRIDVLDLSSLPF